MKEKEKSCDHSLGYLYSYDGQNEIRYSIRFEIGLNKQNTNRRRNRMRMFTFCPDCGTKIDWKTIRKGLK